jgi:hypothetical protein
MLKKITISLFLALSLANCQKNSDNANNSNDVVSELNSENRDIPKEIGAFGVLGEEKSVKLYPYEYDIMMGGFVGTEGMGMGDEQILDPEQYQSVQAGTKILLNKIPLDPSRIYWSKIRGGGYNKRLTTKLSVDGTPASVFEVSPGIYEVSVPEQKGAMGLVIAGSAYPSRVFIVSID